tara:strand:+ start:4892 stop:5119 length:228 start_codon:yes stop_codon:yes gene_type:complete
MTDEELIKWLRDWHYPECHTAADRIETLLAFVKLVMSTQIHHGGACPEPMYINGVCNCGVDAIIESGNSILGEPK